MMYHVDKDGQAVTVALAGQLNFAANDEFCSLLGELATVDRGQVVFDLSALSYLDSVGLGLLHIAKAELTTNGASLSLDRPGSAVMRLLELTDADKAFAITR